MVQAHYNLVWDWVFYVVLVFLLPFIVRMTVILVALGHLPQH